MHEVNIAEDMIIMKLGSRHAWKAFTGGIRTGQEETSTIAIKQELHLNELMHERDKSKPVIEKSRILLEQNWKGNCDDDKKDTKIYKD